MRVESLAAWLKSNVYMKLHQRPALSFGMSRWTIFLAYAGNVAYL